MRGAFFTRGAVRCMIELISISSNFMSLVWVNIPFIAHNNSFALVSALT